MADFTKQERFKPIGSLARAVVGNLGFNGYHLNMWAEYRQAKLRGTRGTGGAPLWGPASLGWYDIGKLWLRCAMTCSHARLFSLLQGLKLLKRGHSGRNVAEDIPDFLGIDGFLEISHQL